MTCIKIVKNFFSTQYVIDGIKQRSLPSLQIFLYFYSIMFFDTASCVQAYVDIAGKIPSLVNYVNMIGLLIINAVGWIILFIVNGGVKGKHLLEKFFSLSFTVGYKYFFVNLFFIAILPSLISYDSNYYQISVFVIVNLIMLFNIAYRVHQSK